MAPKQVVVFIDEKNVYNGARRAFYDRTEHFTKGNFSPVQLGRLLCSRLPHGIAEERELREARVYTGQPSATIEPKSHSAHEKQANFWRKEGAIVVTRPLRYPNQRAPGEQKGVDVALAVDFVVMCIEDQYDIGIIFSSDSDLRPALEYVAKRDCPMPEVACWWSPSSQSYLSIAGIKLWSHRLTEDDYKSVGDYMDYNR